MKKFTLLMLVALVSVMAYAKAPAKRISLIDAAKAQKGVLLQNVDKVSAQRTMPVGKFKAPKKVAEDFPIISEQPEGELKTYIRGGGHYYVSNYQLYYEDQSGLINIVFGADNKVYFQDIVSGLDIDTWVEGTLSEDGSTISVPLGQNIYYSPDYDAAVAIELITYDAETGGFIVNSDASEVTFTVADGVLSLQGTGFIDTSLGAVWTDDGSFQDYGDYESVYSPYTPNLELVTLPEGLEVNEMPMLGTFFADLYDEGSAVTAMVNVAKDGNVFYIQGLAPAMPEAWVKGELDEDGYVEIPITYLGDVEGEHAYMMGYSSSVSNPPVYLIYDEEINSLELDGFIILNVNDVALDLNSMFGYYQGLHIGGFPDLVEVPENVEIAEMPFTATYYDGASSDITGTVTVALNPENGDVYIQGLMQEAPEAWIKGSYTEDMTQVIFPYGQFLGYTGSGSLFAVGDKEVYNEITEDYDLEIADIVFDYEVKKNLLVLQNVIYTSGKKDAIYYYSMLANAIIGNNCDDIWVAADQGYENAQDVTEIQIGEGVKGVLDKAEGKNAPKYYNSGEALRMYAGNTLTITSDKLIGKIIFTLTGGAQQMVLESNVGNYELQGKEGIWTGENTEVVFTVPNESGNQARIQEIKIFYFDYSTTLVEVPADLTVEPYQFKAFDSYYEEDVTSEVKVGFDGNDVYIQGLSYYVPEAWVRGTLAEDGTVTIPEWYMGVYESLFGDYDMVFGGATFNYDREKGVFTCEEGYLTYADGYEMDEYEDVILTKIVEKAATPANPEVVDFVGTGNYPKVKFNIPAEDVDGNPLVSDKLSYIIFIEKGNEISALTLTTDLYEELAEDMTEIPYNFTDDWDIDLKGSTVYLNQGAEELMSWTKIGVQSIYRGAGEEHKSEIAWYDLEEYWITTGIANVNNASEKAVYFDLQGRVANANAKGLLIKQVRQANGTVKTVKVVRK